LFPPFLKCLFYANQPLNNRIKFEDIQQQKTLQLFNPY
jgi:hypothetical protein